VKTAVVIVIFLILILILKTRENLKNARVAVERDPDQFQILTRYQTVKGRESTRNIIESHPLKSIKSIAKKIANQDMTKKKK
jgi:hypothetical protein